MQTYITYIEKADICLGVLDKMCGNPKLPCIISIIIHVNKKVIYMNRQTGIEMYVEMGKHQVYQQFKAEEYKMKLI